MPPLLFIESERLAPLFGPLFLFGTGLLEIVSLASFFNKLSDAKLADSYTLYNETGYGL